MARRPSFFDLSGSLLTPSEGWLTVALLLASLAPFPLGMAGGLVSMAAYRFIRTRRPEMLALALEKGGEA